MGEAGETDDGSAPEGVRLGMFFEAQICKDAIDAAGAAVDAVGELWWSRCAGGREARLVGIHGARRASEAGAARPAGGNDRNRAWRSPCTPQTCWGR